MFWWTFLNHKSFFKIFKHYFFYILVLLSSFLIMIFWKPLNDETWNFNWPKGLGDSQKKWLIVKLHFIQHSNEFFQTMSFFHSKILGWHIDLRLTPNSKWNCLKRSTLLKTRTTNVVRIAGCARFFNQWINESINESINRVNIFCISHLIL